MVMHLTSKYVFECHFDGTCLDYKAWALLKLYRCLISRNMRERLLIDAVSPSWIQRAYFYIQALGCRSRFAKSRYKIVKHFLWSDASNVQNEITASKKYWAIGGGELYCMVSKWSDRNVFLKISCRSLSIRLQYKDSFQYGSHFYHLTLVSHRCCTLLEGGVCTI